MFVSLGIVMCLFRTEYVLLHVIHSVFALGFRVDSSKEIRAQCLSSVCMQSRSVEILACNML